MGGEKLYPIYFHLLKRAIAMVAVQTDVLPKPNAVGVRGGGDWLQTRELLCMGTLQKC